MSDKKININSIKMIEGIIITEYGNIFDFSEIENEPHLLQKLFHHFKYENDALDTFHMMWNYVRQYQCWKECKGLIEIPPYENPFTYMPKKLKELEVENRELKSKLSEIEEMSKGV